MVTIYTRPPAARRIITLSFFIRERWSNEISVIGRVKITKSVIILKVVSVRKTYSILRYVLLVASEPS